MAHGGNSKRRAVSERKTAPHRRPKALAVDKKSKPRTKNKAVSLKNQIRSVARILRKDLPPEVKEAQEKKLEELKKQQDIHTRLAVERKIFLRNRKIKFFERRKIDRKIRRLEKQQRSSAGPAPEVEISEQLSKLKEDLEYVRFFPKTEKYVPLFMGGDETEIVEKRNVLRKQIKANLIAAAASGKDLEETGSEDDGLLDASDDDFFLHGSSSDEADADDELTDKSAREQASSASGKATSGEASDERNQRQISARALMPPPRPSNKPFPRSVHSKSRFASSSEKKPYTKAEISSDDMFHNKSKFASSSEKKPYTRAETSMTSNYTFHNKSRFESSSGKKPYRAEISTTNNDTFQNKPRFTGSFDRGEISTTSSSSFDRSRKRGAMDSTTGNSENQSSTSDARKPRRKRRPKKKKE